MERKNKACWNCGSFCAYYTKGGYKFYKSNKGYCTRKKQIFTNTECCEYWRNNFQLRGRRKQLSLSTLDQLMTDLTAVKQILEEENEECKTDPFIKLI